MNAQETIGEAKRLKEWLVSQGQDDPELLAGMIEGETGLFELRDWAIHRYLDECAFAEAVKARKDALDERKKSAERRSEKMRLLIQDCMTASGEKSYRGPEATITVKDIPPKPIVTDESVIPERFWKVKRDIDKTAINEAFKTLKDGENIAGVVLDNGGVSITIRSK